ncbi:MAG: S8 family serine peptidase, partial [Pseudomonadota bacterium]
MTKAVLKTSAAIIALGVSGANIAYADDTSGNIVVSYEGVIGPSYGSLDAFYGSLDAFWGSLDAFYGSLDAFNSRSINQHYGSLDAFSDLDAHYGSLDAFYGSLDAFYGSLDAFYGHLNTHWGSLDAFYGSLDAFYGSLDAFWGSLDAFYGSLDAFYGSLDAFETPDSVKTDISALVRQSRRTFRRAVEARTGQSFNKAILNPLLDKYGLKKNLSNFHELAPEDVAMLIIEFNDTLLLYSGLDHVDHWMGAIGWSPTLAYEVGAGEGVRIGIIDTLVSEVDEENFNDIAGSYGYRISGQRHGAAVAALINAAHDGYGVMGVAPEAALSFFNPFDKTLTTNWQDVTRAINKAVKENKGNADVINLSLGTPGWTLHQDWTQVFSNKAVRQRATDVVFVKAAGNSGVTQTQDIEWGQLDVHNQLLIVGSVDPSGEISGFSNRPGDACLLTNGVCEPENRLMNRFLVAPGEMLLSSDNAGGVTRVTGTSFAAPLVTGAVALVQGNWPWLKNHPEETADIILQSATDLGEPGVDGTYGWGLLNVDAALEPLDPNNLTLQTANGVVSYASLGGTTNGVISLIGSDVSLTFIEDIGETYRDFSIQIDATPLEGDPEAVQDTETEAYLNARSGGPVVNATQSFASRGVLGFTDGLYVGGGALGDEKSRWLLSIEANRHAPDDVLDIDAVPFQTTSTLVNNETGLTLTFGQGESALNFSGNGAFGMLSDHDVLTGGVNPFLGLASGGTFA